MKFATLPQGISVLQLLRDKKVPQGQITQLLRSGLLSDLFDANLDEVDRNELRRLLGLKPICLGAVDLGNGFIFTIDEVLELEVDYTISPDEILTRGGYNPADWEYVGEKPGMKIRKVKAAIGRMNKPWSEEKLKNLLRVPNHEVSGSGAWVREAFLKVRPRYDGKGWIGFPEPNSSRWRGRDDERVYFPHLWGVGGGWDRRLYWFALEWLPADRVCLLLG